MFCVYLEFPYERQLKKLYPEILSCFIKKVKEFSIDNGGTEYKYSGGYFYCFSEDEIAYSFFVSRFLFLLSDLIKQNNNEINEVRIIAERFEAHIFSDIIADSFFKLKNKLLPLNGIFASAKIVRNLKNYITFSSLKENTLRICTSFDFFEEISNKKIEQKIDKNSIIVHKNGNYLYSVYNFILKNQISENDLKFFNEIEIKSYSETKSSLYFLRENRFTSFFPQYFIDAFLIHSSLHLKALYSVKNTNPVSIFVDDIDDNNNFSEAEKILRITPPSILRELPSSELNLDKIPDDLFDLIYLILFSADYIFFDELQTFFSDLNRSAGINDVIKIMYTNGILLIEDDVYSYVPEAMKIIERKIRIRKKTLNKNIAVFLWQKYKQGVIKPCSKLKEVFDLLSFQYDEEFVLDSFFYLHKNKDIFFSDIEIFKDYKFFHTLKIYLRILEYTNAGEYKKALSSAKKTVSEFQKVRFLGCEYRTLSLLGYLNLKENRISDSITYFLYAFDCAEQSKKKYLICEAVFYLSVAYFIQKNFKKSLLMLQKLSFIISDFFCQEWKIPCLFLQGRIYLELGEFKKSEIMFNSAADFASLYFEKHESLCRVWAGRSLVYDGQITSAQKIFENNIDKTPDAVLFLLESYLFKPIITDEFSQYKIDIDNLYVQQNFSDLNGFELPCSGFSFLEDLTLNKNSRFNFGKNIFLVFYNYYQFRLQPLTNIDSIACAVKQVEDIAMNSLYNKESAAPLYLYLAYDISLRNGEEYKAKTAAFLSKAFKALQYNVLSIGENDIRNKFMQKNIWNAKIFKAAQENKLI